MSKNTNLSFLTDFLTADIVNSRVGMNNVSPQATFDVTGTGKFSGDGSLLTNLPLGAYSTTTTNDTKYLKLDGTNNMALNSSITLTGTGKFIGDGSLLTNLNYNSFTNPPDLTLYNGWTKSGNDIYNTSQSGKVGIGLTNPTGKLEFNYNYPSGTFTNFYLKFGHETKYAFNSIFCNYYYRFIHHIQELMK